MNTIESRVPFADYQASEGLNISALKVINQSPLHYQYRLTHPQVGEPLTLGHAAHCAVLEPERFDRQFRVWTRRTESGKMAPRNGKHWDEFLEAHKGLEIVTYDEADYAAKIALAVRNEPAAMRYLQTGDPEVSMHWIAHDRQCKGRVDWLGFDSGTPVLTGLKTTRDVSLRWFSKQAWQLGYHLQWAWYHDGYKQITGKAPLVREIVVEAKPPHAVAVYSIPKDVIDLGRDDYRELLALLDDCEMNDTWPGPGAGVEQEFALPEWAYPGAGGDLADLDLEGVEHG